MSLDGQDDPFAPLNPEELEAAQKPRAKAPEKVPIIPVPDDAGPVEAFKIPKLGGAPKRLWAYRDAEGRLLGYDGRFEYFSDGKLVKDVMPILWCRVGEKVGWRSKSFPLLRPLYGLDRLAQRPGDPVVIAEGCKSTDAAGDLLPDYVPVSWPGGSKAIAQADWSALAGRDVLIWPDRDRQCELNGTERPYDEQPGSIAADNIVDRLRNVANSVHVLHLEHWDCKGGWDAADAAEEGWDAERTQGFVKAYSVEIDLAAPGTILPPNFEYGEDGLYYVEDLENGGRIRLSDRIKIIAKTRDTQGYSWGRLLEWRDHDGREHRWAMPMSMLAGDGNAVREVLFDRGLYVSTQGKAKPRFIQFLSTTDTKHRAQAVSKVGWAGNAFALPEITIGDTPEDRIIFQHAEGVASQYRSAGTLEEWQEHVGKLIVGNSRLVLLTSAAFVGPLLLPAAEEGGGINLVGASSTGKTTAMRVATSVWGPQAFIRQWRATSNGLEGLAAQHNETLLCLDELSQLEPREAGPIAYMLSNGQGKSRATRSGSSRAAPTWKVMYISTGEVGLADLMKEGKATRTPMAGQEVRILDLPADAGKGMGAFDNIHGEVSPDVFARRITTGADQYYGVASTEYIRRLIGIKDRVGAMVSASIAEFIAKHVPPGSDGQVIRAARRFGLIAAAGELAIALQILPWPKDEAFGACGVMLREWIARRGGIGSAEDRNIIAKVRGFLEAHGEARFAPVDKDIVHNTKDNRAGFWGLTLNKSSEEVREYFIMKEAFAEICTGFDRSAVIKVLRQIGALRISSEGKNQVSKYLPGLGTTKVYHIGPEIFYD